MMYEMKAVPTVAAFGFGSPGRAAEAPGCRRKHGRALNGSACSEVCAFADRRLAFAIGVNTRPAPIGGTERVPQTDIWSPTAQAPVDGVHDPRRTEPPLIADAADGIEAELLDDLSHSATRDLSERSASSGSGQSHALLKHAAWMSLKTR